jgi:hypothetical protein
MKSLISTTAGALVLALAFGTGAALAAQPATPAPVAGTAAPAAPQLHEAMRSLWQGHVQNTRAYAMAVHKGDAAATARAADGVVANARQLSDAVAGFYGDAAGTRMMELLGGHWGGVKALTDATHAGDAAGAEKAMKDLSTNADAIAAFLSGANPHLTADGVRGLLLAHAAHHQAQVKEIMRGDMQAEASTWKAMQAHMDVIADALAGAIAQQFPDKAA